MSEPNDQADLAGRIAVLSVQDGDILIFKTDERLSDSQVARIRDGFDGALARAGAPKCPILVLERGASIEVLRPLPGESPFVSRADIASMLSGKASG